MKKVRSKDGTEIAIDVVGSGPPVVLVDGAMCRRAFGPMPDLAKLLAAKHTVLYYDRRGRGDSGDTAPYALDREIEDLEAVCRAAGEVPCVFGSSSGAALAARAVGKGVPAARLALWEPPFALDGTHTPDPPDYQDRIRASLAAGKPNDAVKQFMRAVGVPWIGVFFMRLMPNVWPRLREIAHTLPNDFEALGDTQRGGPLPADMRALFGAIRVPARVLVGGKSPPWMHHGSEVVAKAIPGATHGVLPGQTHNVAAKVIAPDLLDFFGSGAKAAN